MKINYRNIFKSIVFISLIVFLILYIERTAQWIVHPFSNSYEEYGTVATMNSYLDGINPFSFESFPENVFIYGPLFAWLCSLIYSVFGFQCDHVLFCRSISLTFLILIEIQALKIIHKRINPSISKFSKLILLIIAFSALLATAWQITPISGYSNTFGTFLTLIVYCIVESKDNYKIRNLSLSAALSVLAFFIKPYFMLAIGVALAQLVIQKKYKETLFLSAIFVIFALIAMWFCQLFMPSCLYVLIDAMSHQGMSIIYAIKQWGIISCLYFPFALSLIYLLIKDNRAFHKIPATYKSGVLIASISLLFLGMNEGANLWYFYHLLLLPLTICGVIAISYLNYIFRSIAIITSIVFCVFHFNLNTISPRYPIEETKSLVAELNQLEKDYDLSKSFNFHASLDNWAQKKNMSYVNSLYPNFLLMMTEYDEVTLFKDEHSEALALLKGWESCLKSKIIDEEAEMIISNSDDTLLKKCNIDEHYKVLKTLINPVSDPKYRSINIYVKR